MIALEIKYISIPSQFYDFSILTFFKLPKQITHKILEIIPAIPVPVPLFINFYFNLIL